MPQLTRVFADKVHSVWGSPEKVADVAFSELFNHPNEIGLDYDDQVSYAKRVGVLAGTMKDSTPEEFIEAFNQKVLNEE